LASKLAERFETAGCVVSAIREAADGHVAAVRIHQPLAENAALARDHGTKFPIVQGPMTRVSDNSRFAAAVAEGGALPFIALALSDAAETERVLNETRAALGSRPWGVGILGFVPLAVRTAQMEVIRRVKPAFALIAGGRPDQATALEREGIPTYLHTPSPELLKLFFENGARRFVFEGRECGGHVGPRSSFVLWEGMVDALLSLQSSGADISGVRVLFAGGIHDAVSASMAATLAAPMVEAGVQFGVLLGTAYLFTREAVETGAIAPTFQVQAVECRGTALLESGPGHASRCARTPFVERFQHERRRLEASGASGDEIRGALEDLNLGRLRVAAKGVARHPRYGSDPDAPKLVNVEPGEQQATGMYMLGQLAALRRDTCTIQQLHAGVSIDATARLGARSVTRPRSSPPRPCNVAIIGIGTLLPKVPNVQRFWENILAKVDGITEIPPERFDWRRYYDSDPVKPDKIYSKWGGFLDDLVFDPVRYGMPPHVLPSIEPMQLLTLEVVRAAIADAGYTCRPFLRSTTSIILGAGGGLADLGQQYGMRSGLSALTGDPCCVPEALLNRLPSWTEDSFAGLLLNVAAGRVANRFDLGGVNFTVDAACASSLAAIYTGVRELECGASDVVLAGGVDTVQNPFGYLCFSKTRALSPTGRCRSFDAEADGIAISEGLVILVLKRLADAERDGDRIHAVIKSIAGSSDGRHKGLTAPSPEGQVVALTRAYEAAGISPATVGLIEAHGTGTAAGDLAEVEALKQVFAAAPTQSCAIGSVKSMIGHTKCAAGAAGLAKAAIALHEKTLPPTMHVQKPNPKLDFEHSPFYVNTEARPWMARADGEPRRAGVSAFGFGGTNFHVVLEEYQDPVSARPAPVARAWPSELLVWSAESAGALRESLSGLALALRAGAMPSLAELAAATWRGFRGAAPACLALVASTLDDLQSKLAPVNSCIDAGNGMADPRGIYLRLSPEPPETGRLAFLFPGQGSQQVGMLADLAVYFPEVREAIEEADRLLAAHHFEQVSPYIYPPPQFTDADRERCRQTLSRTEITQPAMGAACMATMRLLGSLGMHPDVVAGHSYGEYVALAAAGVFTMDSFYRLSAARGKCLAAAAAPGTMLAVWEGAEAVEEIITGICGVWIANVNSPRQTVLSGSQAGIAEAKGRLSRKGIEVKPVSVSCAFHSPLVEAAKERLAAVLAATECFPARVPVYSNTSGSLYPQDPRDAAALLADHLVRPVRFRDEVEAMYAAGVKTFVEVGPRSVLTGLVGQILGGRPHLAVAAGGDRSSLSQLQNCLAQLLIAGGPVSLDRLFEGRVEHHGDVAALLESSRPAPPPAGAWLVNGGRARRQGEPAIRPEEPIVFANPPKPAVAQDSGLQSTGLRAAPSPETEAVMVKFQETMTRFLETQRHTMMAYLSAQTGATAGDSQAPEVIASLAPTAVPEAVPRVEPPAAPSPESAAPLPILVLLRTIISERTGYPPEMVDSKLNLEADLGIDSIKRVEILGAFQKSCAAAGQSRVRAALERLSSLKTLGDLAEALEGVLSAPVPPAEPVPVETRVSGPLPRFVLRTVEAPAAPSSTRPPLPDGVVVITDDGRGIAARMAGELRCHGWPIALIQARDLPPSPGQQGIDSWLVDLTEPLEVQRLLQSLRDAHGRVAALLHCLPLADWVDVPWQRRLALEVKGLFHLAKAAGIDLRSAREPRGWLMAATSLGGDLGIGGTGEGPCSAIHGGIAGIVKTLAAEWPDARCRVVDFEAHVDPSDAAEHLLAELSIDGDSEIGYRFSRRVRLQLVPAALPEIASSGAFDGHPTILVTGGARGITAAATLAVAARFRARFLIVGRSFDSEHEESPETAVIESEKELKRALIEQARRANVTPEPSAIKAACSRLLRDREIRKTLRALRQTGAEVDYLACDVSNADEFGKLIDEIYSSYGAIHGVLHGAGIIEDRLLEDKDPRSFDRVLGPKVTGAMVLAERIKPDHLRFLVFFSSVSGRFGNRGQSDYAAANEVLNKLAAQLDRRWPARVVALDWGPWDGSNMVPESLRDQFVRRGVQLIEASAGCGALISELLAGRKDDAEVILGNGPWGQTASAPAQPATAGMPLLEAESLTTEAGGSVKAVIRLDPERHRYLMDHRLDDKPVVPAAMAIEFMAEAARQAWPDSIVTGVKSVRVYKGIVLNGKPRSIRVAARPQTHYSGEDRALSVDVELTDPEQPGVPYYRGTVCLSDALPAPPGRKRQVEYGGTAITAAEAYRDRLFHGPCFRCLKRIVSLNGRGVWAEVTPSRPSDCMRAAPGSSWIIDPILLDAGPQLLILWAQEMRGMTALPSRFGEVTIFSGLLPLLQNRAEDPLRCHLLLDAAGNGPIITATYEVFGPDGNVVLSVTGLESTASESLNRLAARAAGATS
jgi:acyl transferase domain-containing protein/NAD(P)-dependent dehydrogenase (short-subunit alcohol dehydrogenase family)/NAD(P)H-dependent flavin oxidoreductase YrpB (nitropropane dioxygenase family)